MPAHLQPEPQLVREAALGAQAGPGGWAALVSGERTEPRAPDLTRHLATRSTGFAPVPWGARPRAGAKLCGAHVRPRPGICASAPCGGPGLRPHLAQGVSVTRAPVLHGPAMAARVRCAPLLWSVPNGLPEHRPGPGLTEVAWGHGEEAAARTWTPQARRASSTAGRTVAVLSRDTSRSGQRRHA